MNGNGYTFEALLTQVIRKMWDVEIVGISEQEGKMLDGKFHAIGTKNMKRNILIYVQQDATLHSLFYLETALHVSVGTTTHH